MVSNKIDNNGKYKEFLGVTVLANVINNNKWNNLYNLLQNSFITDYVSLLPVDSYHLTIINLFTNEHQSNNNIQQWNNFIDNELQWFQNLYNDINLNTWDLKVTFDRIKIVGPNVGHSICILVNISTDLINKIHELANKYNIAFKIPPAFHITLGYVYKDVTSDIVQKCYEEITKYIASLALNDVIELDRPQLTYFNDMTKFISWDGTYNPFLIK